MAHPLVADGGYGLQIWWVAVNILIKQLQTADKGLSSNFGLELGANNSSVYNPTCYKMLHRSINGKMIIIEWILEK
jgi:hypothetical protein